MLRPVGSPGACDSTVCAPVPLCWPGFIAKFRRVKHLSGVVFVLFPKPTVTGALGVCLLCAVRLQVGDSASVRSCRSSWIPSNPQPWVFSLAALRSSCFGQVVGEACCCWEGRGGFLKVSRLQRTSRRRLLVVLGADLLRSCLTEPGDGIGPARWPAWFLNLGCRVSAPCYGCQPVFNSRNGGDSLRVCAKGRWTRSDCSGCPGRMRCCPSAACL